METDSRIGRRLRLLPLASAAHLQDVSQSLLMPNLDELADAVSDEPTLIAFMNALAEDWEDERRKEAAAPTSPYGPGASGWENGSIGAFLDAAAAWAEASARGMPEYSVPENPWRRLAHILRAGKSYE